MLGCTWFVSLVAVSGCCGLVACMHAVWWCVASLLTFSGWFAD